MRLREKKRVLAARAIRLIEDKNLVKSAGDFDGPFLMKLRSMVAGEDTPFDDGMNWLKIDTLGLDPELNRTLNELSEVDNKIRLFGWIPWL